MLSVIIFIIVATQQLQLIIGSPEDNHQIRSFCTRIWLYLMFLIQIVDRNRPSSHRSELKSCTILMDEQSNP